MSAQTRSQISRLLADHDVRPAHRLGQHFLADANITRKIVAAAGVEEGDRVVEVGAGTGTLTAALARSGATVVAYEIDTRLRPILEEVTAGLAVELRFEDVTRVDLSTELEGAGWAMVANLPYNVGTSLVIDTLRRVPAVELLVVMVQREVAERFVASPGTGEYGIPSVAAGVHADSRIAFKVAPQVFVPSPTVESAVVVMRRKEPPRHAERAIELARAGFSQRRKMLRRSLAAVLDDPEAALESAGIDPTARAQALSPHDYIELARVSS